jgi:ATP-binding cassette subfamily B (MDR/TAP) protein 1
MHADKIAVLSSGKVVETGTHQELLAKNGRYAALVRAQNLWGMETREDTKGERVGLKRSGEADQFAQQPQPTAQLCPETTKLSGQDEEFGTMNKSLFSCFFILIREQKGLYRLFMFAVPASVIAAGNLPVQAFLFSKLIDVFTLTPQEGQVQADFLALMLLALALVNALTYLILEWVCNLVRRFRVLTALH